MTSTSVCPSAGAEDRDTTTVEIVGDGVGGEDPVPNVTDVVPIKMAVLGVVSLAVRVTDSDWESVVVKVATPEELVTSDPLEAGVITTLPVPVTLTVWPTTGWGSAAWSRRVTVTVADPPLTVPTVIPELAGVTTGVTKVTVGWAVRSTGSVVSVAVRVTVSTVASVTLKVATPEELVTLEPLEAGAMLACPVPPVNVTVLPATGTLPLPSRVTVTLD
jgi:hypothetical protein